VDDYPRSPAELSGLDLIPAAVFGTSAGASIVVNLALRHPELLRGAIFHEPLSQSGVSDADAVRAGRRAQIEKGMAEGGPPAAAELFLRSVAGDEVYESLDRHAAPVGLGNAGCAFDLGFFGTPASSP